MFKCSLGMVRKFVVFFLLTAIVLGCFKLSLSQAQSEDCPVAEGNYPITVAWRPQGDIIAVAGTPCYGIQFFNESLEQILWISLNSIHITFNERILYVEWSPDGRFLAIPTSSDGIVIWDYESQSIYLRLETSPIWATWSPNGKYLAFGGDIQSRWEYGPAYQDTIHVIDVLESREVAVLSGLDLLDVISPVWIDDESLYFLGQTYSGPRHGVYRWSLTTTSVEQVSPREFAMGRYTEPTYWNAEGDALIVRPNPPDGEVGTLAVWYFTDNRLILRDVGHEPIVWLRGGGEHILWSSDNRYILFSDVNYFAIFDPETMRVLQREHHTDCNRIVPTRPAAWHPDGDRFVVASPCGLTIVPINVEPSNQP